MAIDDVFRTGDLRRMSRARPGAVARVCAGDAWKRPFDLVVLALAALLLLPLWIVLAAAIPLAIRLKSAGPALYRQARLGRNGQVFRILKFRTMEHGAERRAGPAWAAWRDARVTRVGRVLRRWHLDELPQALNVIRGEMSLVGPRPERPELAERIGREVAGYGRRLAVRPGIASLAQAASGPYDLHQRRKLRFDLRCIDAMSPWMDLWLIALCVARVLRQRAHGAWRALAPPVGRVQGLTVPGSEPGLGSDEA